MSGLGAPSMANGVIDLGHLVLVSTTSNNQVKAQSLVQFAPAVDAGERRSELTTGISSSGKRSQPWRTTANHWHFTIHIRGDDSLADLRQDFAESLADTIREAPLWGQLNFCAYAVQCTPAYAIETDDVVMVTLRRNETNIGSKSTLHKLCTGVPLGDVKPPCGVEVEIIESFRLVLDFVQLENRKRHGLDHEYRSPTKSGSNGIPGIDNSFEDIMDGLIEYGTEVENGDSCYGLDAGGDIDHWPPREIGDNLMLESQKGRETAEPLSFEPMQCQQPAQLTSTTLYANQAGYQHEDTVGVQSKALEPLLALADAAIRTSIFGSPRRLGNGIRVSRKDSFIPYVDVSPSVWSPGHMPAISSRACFLPTLSHALTMIGRRSGVSRRLDKKVKEFASMSLKVDPADDRPSITEDQVSIQLWRSLQRGCYNPASAAPLKALRVQESAPLQGGHDSDALLDRGHEAPMDAGPGPSEVCAIQVLSYTEGGYDEESLLC